MAKVSIIIPSRNEQFLVPTVNDLLSKARGDVELVVICDGYWPDPPLPDDKRIKVIHFGDAQGMRPGINAAAQIATGEFLMKADAHTMWAEGFDETLQEACVEGNWICVPRRYALDPEAWAIDTSNRKYPIDYHYLSYPYERPGDPKCGLHGTEWRARRDARKDVPIDDEMSSQGSAWFMRREHWQRLGPMESERYGNFVQEFQELGLKTWLGGGAVKVVKNTWYAHLFKGQRYGRGYSMGATNHVEGSRFCVDYWMRDRWEQRARDLRWLIERFSPVPGWPDDLDVAFPRDTRTAIAVLATPPAPAIAIPDGTRRILDAAQRQDGGREVEVDATRADLAVALRELGLNRGAEIGVEQGAYSEVLCQTNPAIDLLCVDAWAHYTGYRDHVSQDKLDGFYEATKARLAPYRASLVRAYSVDASRGVPDGSLDFVYIDANHRFEQVVADLAAWVPKVRTGGIVAGHDYRKDKGAAPFHVTQAVQGWTSAYRVSPWFVLRAERSPSWFWVVT